VNRTVAELAKIISQVLKQLREENGFTPPIQVIIVGACGSVLCIEYKQGESGKLETGEEVAERIHPPGFRSPVNILLVDSRGDVGRVRLGLEGPTNLQRLN